MKRQPKNEKSLSKVLLLIVILNINVSMELEIHKNKESGISNGPNYFENSKNKSEITTIDVTDFSSKIREKRNDEEKDNEIVLRYETFEPCDDGFITMDRFIGLPFEEENYFNATVHLKKYEKNIPHAEIDIKLDNAATITVNPKEARVRILADKTIYIRTHVLPPTLNLTVRAPALKPFPNLKSVTLNTKVLCVNPKKWSPTLQGPSANKDQISVRFLIPEEEAPLHFCGRKQIDEVALVTKSQDTEAGDWPWHVAIYKRSRNFESVGYQCGGSIISKTTIITGGRSPLLSFASCSSASCLVGKAPPTKVSQFIHALPRLLRSIAGPRHAPLRSPTQSLAQPLIVQARTTDTAVDILRQYTTEGSVGSDAFSAHCCVERGRPVAAERLKIAVGKYHLNLTDPHSKEYQVDRVIIHNRFNPHNFKNDIALLKLTEHITYNDYVQPVCLWNFKQISKNYLFGEIGTLVGWGSPMPNSSLSETLRSGTMEMVSDTTCLLSLTTFFQNFVSDDTFCAGNGPIDGTSACNGDSGGALIFNITLSDGEPSWFLRGIVSISVSKNRTSPLDAPTCDPSHYNVFTDTARYLTWIHSHTEEDETSLH